MCVPVQAAAQCYIDLIIKESDNNVKLIVLDRLIELKEHPTHERVLQVLIHLLLFSPAYSCNKHFIYKLNRLEPVTFHSALTVQFCSDPRTW